MFLGSYNNSLRINDQDDLENSNNNSEISASLRFWTLLTLVVPSIGCSFMILWVLISNRKHRFSLSYRGLIVQLIAGVIYMLIHFPIYLTYLRLGYVWPQTSAMCYIWLVVGDGFTTTTSMLMVWASFERHMFIFHNNWLSSRRKKILRHYLPFILIIFYWPVYYFIVIVFPPCEHTFDYTKKFCSSSCLYRNRVFDIYNTMVNNIIATFFIALFCLSLILRVCWHSCMRHQRRIPWRKHRRLIIILVLISCIYLAFNLPVMILEVVELWGRSNDFMTHLEPYFDFLNYLVFITYPWICFGTMFTIPRTQRLVRAIGTVEIAMTQRTKSKVLPQFN